jgi:hypothetical protein
VLRCMWSFRSNYEHEIHDTLACGDALTLFVAYQVLQWEMEASTVPAGGRPVSSPLACGVECKMTTKVRLLKSMLLVVLHRCNSYLPVCYNGFPTPHTPSSSPSPSQPPAITISSSSSSSLFYRFHHTQVHMYELYICSFI